MKRLLFPLLLLTAPAFAYEELGFDEFFKVKENNDKFEFIAQSGNMEKLRSQAMSMEICKHAAKDQVNPEPMCECISQEMKKLSDKDWFYSSTLAYQRYLAKAAALNNNDTVEIENIKTRSQENPLPIDKVEQVCDPK